MIQRPPACLGLRRLTTPCRRLFSEDVTVLLFLVAIQEFDQSLYEDESVNRLQESVTLFESVANSRYFANSSIILFLNKIDLFQQKLRGGTQLRDYCPDYTGENEYEPA